MSKNLGGLKFLVHLKVALCNFYFYFIFWYMKYRVYYPLIGHADLIEC